MQAEVSILQACPYMSMRGSVHDFTYICSMEAGIFAPH